jgi:tetraacyldisaccharide 4'-kinase
MLKAIDMRVIVKRMDLKDYQHLFFTRLSASGPKPVFNEKIQWPGTFTASRPMIIMVAGIAAPRTFKPFVRKLSTNIHELTFGDHHDYTERDIEKILAEYRAARGDEKYILTTEKDSVKWLPFRQLFKEAADRVFYIPAGIEFLNKDSAEFNTYIKNYVRSNKKSSSIYSD